MKGNGDGYFVSRNACYAAWVLMQRTDLNLPLCGISATLAVLFLNISTPPGTFKEKFLSMDWMSVIFTLHMDLQY